MDVDLIIADFIQAFFDAFTIFTNALVDFVVSELPIQDFLDAVSDALGL